MDEKEQVGGMVVELSLVEAVAVALELLVVQ